MTQKKFLKGNTRTWQIALMLVCGILCLSGCEKNDDLPPRSFNTTVEDIDISSMVVRWTESTDPENSIVKYRVYIAEDVPEAEFQLVADNISETQFPKKDREFFFFHRLTGLNHNTSYKGKVVAFDQDGMETETAFSAKTVEDTYVPIITDIGVLSYRSSAKITVEMDFDSSFIHDGELTADLYLEGALVTDALAYEVSHLNEYINFSGVVENLEENTNYNARVVIRAENNSNETDFSFSTAGDTFEGDITFWYQEEVVEFAINQFLKVKGDVICYLPSGCHPEDPYDTCDFNITDLSILDSIIEVEGNIFIGSLDPSGASYTGSPVKGFKGLQTITGNLEVYKADLTDLFGLINNVGGNLSIRESAHFTSMSLFTDLDFIGGDIEIALNHHLEDFCALQTVVTNGLSGSYEVTGNGYNPTVQDIINGNCSQ